MSLRANVIANYAGQAYVTVINLLMVPVYLRYMGTEAFGLVGFFAMLQMWFQLLDMGMTATMSREAARHCAGATDRRTIRSLLHTLEGIFIAIAVAGATAMTLGADLIAQRWLKVQSLPIGEVRNAIIMMALIIALRWIGGLYRGTISGMEKQLWLNGFNAASTTARCLLAIPLFMLVGSTITDFFALQLLVTVLESVWLLRTTYYFLPPAPQPEKTRFDLACLRPLLGFTLSVAFTSAVWVLVTQTDKLILSTLVPLADYASFTLAVLAAGGITLISGPLTTALQPRLTNVAATGNNAGLLRLYRMATQLTGIICVPAALVLAFFSEQVLWMWTGDRLMAGRASHVLALYALGNGLLVFSALPYLLQFAKGDMKLHVLGNALLAVLLIPALVWATIRHGVDGAGYAWLGSNAAFFLLWVPIVHRRFFKRLHTMWLAVDVGMIVLPAAVGAAMLAWLIDWPQERLATALVLACSGIVLLLLSALGSSWIRAACLERMATRRRVLFTERGET